MKNEKNMKIVTHKKSRQLIIEDILIEDSRDYSYVVSDVSTSAKITVEGKDIFVLGS